MKVGDRVKWAQPQSTEEESERFTLLEINGDRCFVRFLSDLPISPIQVVRLADLTLDPGGQSTPLSVTNGEPIPLSRREIP